MWVSLWTHVEHPPSEESAIRRLMVMGSASGGGVRAALVMALTLLVRAVAAADTLVIDAKTDLKQAFECSRVHPIGYYNEYYVTCELRDKPLPRRLQLQSVAIHGSDVYAEAGNVHVELALVLNTSEGAATAIELNNSAVYTSAVRLEAARVAIDANSSLNVSANGLKFGPGYNSWFNMGGSYGGLGGAALAGMQRGECEVLPPLDFYRAIGSVGGDLGNFQGYGSGGGDDKTRGGGRIEIKATQELALNGSCVANGGDARRDSSDSAGSGGSILIESALISGSGTIRANGGDPVSYDRESGGGGGGGGGGRIVIHYKKMGEWNATQIQAYGGGVLDKKYSAETSSVQWCQLGGDGSILKVQLVEGAQVGNLVIKGRRVEHGVPAKPVQIYGCSPLFYTTPRGDPFVPRYVAQLFVTGGASLCTNYLQLQPTVSSTNSSIVVESGSMINVLDGNRTVVLGATHVSIQCYVGPLSQTIRDAFTFELSGDDVTLANAQVLVEEVRITAATSAIVDKFSVVKFRSRVDVSSTSGDVQILGSLEPEADESVREAGKDVRIVGIAGRGSVVFTPQPAQLGALVIEIHATEDATVDLPFETPFINLFASANNLVIARLSGGALHECKAIEKTAGVETCRDLKTRLASTVSPFMINMKAKTTLTLGNITSGSILVCSDGVVSVEGEVSGDGLGCSPNLGPGTSSVVNGASGGAGHGGRGGNVEPGNTGGGKAYDFPPSEIWSKGAGSVNDNPSSWPIWPGSGAAAGDGSGAIAGGSGGGVIYIGARQMTFSKPSSRVSARGSVGTKNGGGGSGGSVALFIGELQGSGSIDVSGGASTAPASLLDLSQNSTTIWGQDADFNSKPGGGGGGGGGIIRIFFRGDQPGTSGNGDQFIKDGGKLELVGGKAAGGEDGGPGIVAAVNCSAGRGGGLCQQCQPGSFSPGNESHCLPCEPGSYSDKSGLGLCLKCDAGSFNPDFGKKTCDLCAPGSFTKDTGSKSCSPCAPGSYADKLGTASCLLCPVGTVSVTAGSVNCTLCGIGETTLKPGALHCVRCSNKPEHAMYNVPGKCTYACEKGRNGLDCLTPFERFVKPIGGPIGFVILILGFTSAVFGSWGFITYRTNADQKFRERFAQYKAQTQRDEFSLTNLTKNLTPRLTDQDLVGHVTRLYFSGENHMFSSWHLNPFGIPNELKDLVRDEDAFASFATLCNELVAWPDHGGWECWVHRVLLVVFPPLSTVFLRKRQLHRVERLAKHVTQYTGGFVRELGFRRHGAQLKVGFSPDFSLAYFDVLTPVPTNSSSTSPTPPRSRITDRIHSTTSLLIAVAGSGSFFRPYHVDTNDVLVRAVPARLELLHHQFWIDFVAEMNQRLRLLEQPNQSPTRQARARYILHDIVQFVASFNQQRFDSADGIGIRFGSVESVSTFVDLRSEDISTKLESYAQEPFKFALLVAKKGTATPRRVISDSRPGHDDERVVHDEESATSIDIDDPRPMEFRYSQIRMAALFDQPNPADNDGSEPLLEKPRHRRSRDASRLTDALLCSPWSRSFQWLQLIGRPVAPLLRLRNLPPRLVNRPFVMPLTMLLLLIADCVVVFWVLMEYYCIQVDDPTAHDSGCSRVAFVSVLSILPLANVGTPLLGLVFLTRKSVFYGKLFAVWSIGSIVNLLVALICGVVYFNYIRETVMIVIACGLLLKVLEKEMALRCIAQYTIERPLRGWRGLHTTKDWYDAAYTPLIHQER